MLLYGQRVRKITYYEGAGNISPSIFAALEDSQPQEYMLPNLKSLVWKAETPEGLERGLTFLVPELQSLTVETSGRISQQDVEDFLGEVSSLSELKALSITSSVKLSDRLPRFLLPLDTFERVSLMAPGALSPSIGRWLSKMPTLRYLQLDVSGKSETSIAAFFGRSHKQAVSSPDTARTPDSGVFSADELEALPEKLRLVQESTEQKSTGFKQLRSLQLTGEIASVNLFLSHLNCPIESLQLVIDDPEEEGEWRNLFATVQKQLHVSLHALDVSPTSSSRYTDLVRSTPRLDIASRHLPMDNLISLPQLVRMEIEMPLSTVFYEADIKRLALACPNIEILRLCHLSRWPTAAGPPKLPLGGLRALTAECKRLHTLSISVHATAATDDAVFDLKTSSRSLLRLHVGHSWVGDTLEASILLSHLAPHLESLKWFHEKNRPGYIEANDIGWQKVSTILVPLQRLQLRERKRAVAPKEDVVVSRRPAPKVRMGVDKAVDATQADKITVSEGVQTYLRTTSRAVEARPQTRHKSVLAQPKYLSEIVDATVQIQHESVDAVPSVKEQFSQTDVQVELPKPEEVIKDYKSEASMATFEVDDSLESKQVSNYRPSSTFSSLGDAVWSIFRVLRLISPNFVVRVFDMLPLVSVASGNESQN